MENSLEAYITAIQNWNNCRSNSAAITELISDGHFFHITRDMFNFWNTKSPLPEYIHAYIGVETEPSTKALFLLIDSNSDKEPETVKIENIFYTPYLYGFNEIQKIPSFSSGGVPNMNVSILSGLERSFRWMLNRKKWIERKVAQGTDDTVGIFQAIHIPFSDLVSIFEYDDAETAVVVFGLKDDNTVELLVWSEDFKKHEDVEDVALPIPPYGNIDNYYLLKMALGI